MALTDLINSGDPAAVGGIFALAAGLIFFIIILSIGFYIYTSLAYAAIARKNKQESPGLAWIPGVGPLIVAYKASKMDWWPWLLAIGFLIPFLNILAALAFMVFAVIWHWKMFEAIKKPGWWAIFMVIPMANIVFWVFIGIAAWSKD